MSGFYVGFCAIILGINFGLPLWALFLLYPFAGTFGCLAFVVRVMIRDGAFTDFESLRSHVHFTAQNN